MIVVSIQATGPLEFAEVIAYDWQPAFDGLFLDVCLDCLVLSVDVKGVLCHDNLPQIDSSMGFLYQSKGIIHDETDTCMSVGKNNYSDFYNLSGYTVVFNIFMAECFIISLTSIKLLPLRLPNIGNNES
ncbi:MAG: hypothetical protein H6Q53_2075 [Deltaproteobacteria bacterium]|nr:hypothetical protein [Deltaproteobacteria bacterium]